MTQIAVLGLGSIGTRHSRNLIEVGATVIGYDPRPECAPTFEAMGGKFINDKSAAIEASEAVVIASPNRYHLDDLEMVSQIGRPVFVEKPISHKLDGLEACLETFAQKDLPVYGGLILRHHPAVQAAKSILAEERLGKTLWARFIMSDYLPSWRPNQDYRKGFAADPVSGGVLLDMIHEFDLANLLMGPGKTIFANARSSGQLDMKAEDVADVMLQHPNGSVSTLHLDYITHPRQRNGQIAGETGLLDIDLDNRTLKVWDTENILVENLSFPGSYDTDFLTEIRSFLACISSNEPIPCDGETALAVLQQVVSARRIAGLPN